MRYSYREILECVLGISRIEDKDDGCEMLAALYIVLFEKDIALGRRPRGIYAWGVIDGVSHSLFPWYEIVVC